MVVESIQYVTDFAGVFIGLGMMVILFIGAAMFYQFVRAVKSWVDHEIKHTLLEDIVLERVALDKGINLQEEVMKREIFEKKSKSFRREIERQMVEDFFESKKK